MERGLNIFLCFNIVVSVYYTGCIIDILLQNDQSFIYGVDFSNLSKQNHKVDGTKKFALNFIKYAETH